MFLSVFLKHFFFIVFLFGFTPRRPVCHVTSGDAEVFLSELFTFVWGQSRTGPMLGGRLLEAASSSGACSELALQTLGFGGWVRGLVLHSGTRVDFWGRVSMSLFSLCLCLTFYLPLSCLPQRLLSPLRVPLKFVYQPSGPEEHPCPSSFPICPVP